MTRSDAMFERGSKVVDIDKLRASRAMIVGLGASTCFAEPLVRAGLGAVVLVDHDVVELANISRQGHEVVGMPKVLSAKRRLQSINPELDVKAMQMKFSEENSEVTDVASTCDILIFATDSFEAQAAGNRVSMRTAVPGVWVGVGQAAECGEVVWYIPGYHKDCMRCLLERRYLSWQPGGDPTSEGALFADLQIVDGIAAHIAIAILTRGAENYFGRMIDEFDGRQYLQISLRSSFSINGSNPIRRRLGIAEDNSTHVTYCTRFERNGRRLAPCADCQSILGRTFDANELVAVEL